MKSLFALILCGIACCFALPKCSDDEMLRCFKYNFTIDITEEVMEKYCDQVQCMYEVFARCGNPESLPYDAYRHTKEVYDTFCPKINPFRQKFMYHISCIFKTADEILRRCKPVQHDVDHEEFCRELSHQIKCAEELTRIRCGQNAYEVAVVLNPSLKHYNCPV